MSAKKLLATVLIVSFPAALLADEGEGGPQSSPTSARQAGDNAVVPGRFFVDNPTLQNLAFRWLIDGDANGNAAVTVEYSKKGTQQWRPALPMMRVNNDPIKDLARIGSSPGWFDGSAVVTAEKAPNLFAGSVLNLEPGTTYEVRFELTDPDGLRQAQSKAGSVTKTVTVSTRPVPAEGVHGKRQMHVYPPGHKGKKLTPGFADLATAFKEAKPGDLVLIHAGVYVGQFRVSVDGTETEPVIFRGAGDGEAVIDGDGYRNASVVEAEENCHHLWFEDLTVRGGRVGIRATHADGVVIRRCKVLDCNYGISIGTGKKPSPFHKCSNWYIADNVVRGRYPTWAVRKKWYYGSGIQVSGRGHIVCYNEVSHFWDCVGTGHITPPVRQEWTTDPHGPMQAIDFYNNDVSVAMDDGMEIDYVISNVRIMRNRVSRGYVGISIQPSVSGPIYLTHNVLTQIPSAPWKFNVYCAGLRMYHNISLGALHGFYTNPGSLRSRNNIMLVKPGVMSLYTKAVDLDFNAYLGKLTRIAFPTRDKDKSEESYSSLQEFSEATGNSRHSLIVTREDCFAGKGDSSEDLQLKPGSAAIDAGVVLPTLNDNFTGKAPDLGPYEHGQPVPHYGPRVAGLAVSQEDLAWERPGTAPPAGIMLSKVDKLPAVGPPEAPPANVIPYTADPVPAEALEKALTVRSSQKAIVLLKAGEELCGKVELEKAGVKAPSGCEVLVVGPDDKEMHHQQIQAGGSSAFKVRARKAGPHRIDVTLNKGCARLFVENHYACLVVPRPVLRLIYAQPRVYFLTKPRAVEADVSVLTDSPLESCVMTLYDPDGKEVVAVDTARQPTYKVTFKVPPEYAGKAWSLTFTESPREGKVDDIVLALGKGCVPLLSTDPSRLLVPAD